MNNTALLLFMIVTLLDNLPHPPKLKIAVFPSLKFKEGSNLTAQPTNGVV